MHRTYNPVLPTPSKLLQQRWDQTYYDEHRRKVKDVSPMVDTRAPATYMHLHLKLKKLQLEEERLATIERDNRILLEKMSYIMRTRGRIDNRNNYEYKSLNREKRQRELLRVTTENQDILRRIMVRNAEYSAEHLQRDWEQNQKFMDNIARFPRDWWKREDTRMSKRSGSRSSAHSRKHKHNHDDNESTKSESGQEKEQKDDTQKESDESKNVKSQKDTKTKKDSKSKDTKKTSRDEGNDKETKNEGKEEDKKEVEEEGAKGVKG